jgi:hypothetical protein
MTEKNGSKTIEMLKKIQLEEKDRRQVLGISDKGLVPERLCEFYYLRKKL